MACRFLPAKDAMFKTSIHSVSFFCESSWFFLIGQYKSELLRTPSGFFLHTCSPDWVVHMHRLSLPRHVHRQQQIAKDCVTKLKTPRSSRAFLACRHTMTSRGDANWAIVDTLKNVVVAFEVNSIVGFCICTMSQLHQEGLRKQLVADKRTATADLSWLVSGHMWSSYSVLHVPRSLSSFGVVIIA